MTWDIGAFGYGLTPATPVVQGASFGGSSFAGSGYAGRAAPPSGAQTYLRTVQMSGAVRLVGARTFQVSAELVPAANRITAQTSGLASAGSTWVGGVAPVDGDFIQIPAGITVTQDVNRIYGDKTTGAYHAVEILGSSSSSYGEFIVNDGVTVTLRGFNNDDNYPGYWNMRVQAWGKFTPLPGSTILLDVAANEGGVIGNEGIITAIGTAAKPITFDIPAANKNWNTAHSYDFSYTYLPYDRERNIAAARLNAPCLSNAAGTDIGTAADSSVVFSAQSPAGILTTPVASISLVNGAGKYYVDHEGGFVFYYTTQADGTTAAFHVSAKKLATTSCRIRSRGSWDGNQAVFRYCNMTAIGGPAGGIEAQYKTNATGTQRFEVTHCTFKYSFGIVMLNGVAGTATDRILIEDNEFIGSQYNNYTADVSITGGQYPYLSVQRNKAHISLQAFMNDYYSTAVPYIIYQDNVSWTNTVVTKADRSTKWVGASINGNAMIGLGGMADARMMTSQHGTSTDRTVHQNNLVWRGQRAISYGEYNDLFDNIWAHTWHHMIMAQDNVGQGVTPNVRIRRNLAMYGIGSGAIEVGYNYDNLQDSPEIEHNTLYRCGQALSFGDQSDSTGMQMQLGFIERSNLIVEADIAVRRPTDVALQGSRTHIASADYNNIYGSKTADFGTGHFARFCTPSGVTNCAGVSLFNPSFSAPVSGKTLAYVVGSATSRTLSWDGGAAVELYRESGQVTSAEANATWPDLGYLNDSSKAWPLNQYNNAASVVGAWVVITGGTGAGQVRRILYNSTATRLIVAYGWTTPLDATSTYQIWRSEVTLSNAGATQTIDAGIDWRVLPATSQTDAAVAIAFNGKSLDPQFVDPTRSIATWDASLGGPGTEEAGIARLYADPTLTRTSLLPHIRAGFAPTNPALSTAAHDGTTIGAVPASVTTNTYTKTLAVTSSTFKSALRTINTSGVVLKNVARTFSASGATLTQTSRDIAVTGVAIKHSTKTLAVTGVRSKAALRTLTASGVRVSKASRTVAVTALATRAPTAPTITAPTAGSTVSGVITVTCSTSSIQ